MITTPVALLVLLSALMHATWNCVLKTSPDRLLDTVAMAVAGSVLAACLLPFVPLPNLECLPWLGMTLLIHVGYFLFLVETYRHSDLSIAYPLMRGTAPIFVAVGSLLAGEAIGIGLLTGIAMIGIGILLPVGLGMRHGSVTRTGIGFAMGNAAIIAIYTLSDGIGVRLSGSAVAYTIWLYFLNAWGILLLAWRQRGRVVMTYLQKRWRTALIGAILSLGSYGIILWAMTTASIPAVAALRETSVIFATLLGVLLLKEMMGRWRITGALLVALGAAVIRWS